MSQITIQCRLVASESTRQSLWNLMAEANTPLINELLVQVGQQPDFETWRQTGRLKAGIVKQLCEPLKTDPRFIGQPARFYTSAMTVVEYIYKSWLALQKGLQSQLDRRRCWLEMLKSDADLVLLSACTLDTLRTKAAEILAQFAPQSHSDDRATAEGRSLYHILFTAYRQCESDDLLTRCAICYLLKYGCTVSDEQEDLDKFKQRRRQVEIRVERLTERLAARMPKGRDLTNARWLESLSIATYSVPKDDKEEAPWQANLVSLLRKSSPVPFPVVYETNGDMTWSKNSKGRICVKFNGLGEHTFEVYCDQRQLHWFQRFLEDQQIKRESKSQHSSALFTLRSGRIAWQEGVGKENKWNVHHLTLYCTVDNRLWTDEGTKQVAKEKSDKTAKVLTRTKEKGDLNEKQQAFIKRQQSTLAKINTPFPRPVKPLYQGQSHILVGVSLGLEKPATAAVVDALTGQVITYRSIRQLLGDDYKLLNSQRQQQHHHAHQRSIAQKQGAPNHFGESGLGEHIDQLLALSIVSLAQQNRAGSIVIPKLKDVREIIQSEIQAKAEQKCPGSIEGQKNYAKQYRSSVHRWSYARLIKCISSQAVKVGIVIEECTQPLLGTPQEKAKDLAISVYKSRVNEI